MGSLRLPAWSGQEGSSSAVTGTEQFYKAEAQDPGVESRKLVMTGLGEGDSGHFLRNA